jgi:small subunit ribosomal protein S9
MVASKHDRNTGEWLGTGRRKTSIARVRVKAGNGKLTINQRPFEEYFCTDAERRLVLETLDAVGQRGAVDVQAQVNGGGQIGQAGAVRLGLARALVGYNADLFPPLRDGGFLTRDSRMKERKKYGLRGARRGVQFSKR